MYVNVTTRPVVCYFSQGNPLIRDCDIAPQWFAELKVEAYKEEKPFVTIATVSAEQETLSIVAITRSQCKVEEEPEHE